MHTHDADDLVVCPVCQNDQEDTAEDHTIPGNRSKPIKYGCDHCEEEFTVRQLDDGSYKVEESNENH